VTSRSKYHYIQAALGQSSEIRDELFEHKPHIPAENLVSFEKQLPRSRTSKKTNSMSTPFYNPNFEYIKERLDAGVPIFDKQSARKHNLVERNCLNEYDIEDVDRGINLNSKILSPRFDKMPGREP
jgi:hypothetical protein